MIKSVYGVGINDADYVVKEWEEAGYVGGRRKQKLVWICPFYQTWVSMLSRCYCDKYRVRRPTYTGAAALEGWWLFSTFKAWMEKQDWEGKELDKDLLFPGNKVYGPDTCVFVSRQVNMFLVDRGAARGEYMIGCYWDKASSKFKAQCCNPFTKKHENLGNFESELEAHKAWLTRKLEHAYTLAELQTDERVAKALVSRYINYKAERESVNDNK